MRTAPYASRRLIVNADDFGQNSDVTDATIALFESGGLTSATILLNMPDTERALVYARANAKRFSFGLHFNIVDQGIPVASPPPTSLLGNDGLFLESNLQRKRALRFQARAGDIARELDAQLSTLRDAGVSVTHVDSHGHLHKFPVVVRAMRTVMARHGIRRIRRTQDLFLRPKHPKTVARKLSNAVFQLAFPSLSQTDHFFMLHEHDQEDWLSLTLAQLPAGVTEIGVHPGTGDPWRAVEMAPLRRRPLEDLLRSHAIAPISFHDI